MRSTGSTLDMLDMLAMDRPTHIHVRRPAGVNARIRPPGSKSLTNRALLLAAFARGRSRLVGCLDSEDTRSMREGLEALGVRVQAVDEGVFEVEGAGLALGDRREATLAVGTAGTTARFVTAILAASHGHGRFVVDGSPRMRERPMDALIDSLREMGGELRCLGEPGALPLEIRPRRLHGGTYVIERPASSQFVSALVLAASAADAATRLIVRGGTPARPYVDMTLAQLARFGGHARWSAVAPDELEIEPAELQGTTEHIEPDASAASYFLALAAIHGGRVTIPELGTASLQGDAGFHRVLARMGAASSQDERETTVEGRGALVGVDLDLGDMPDMTLTAAVTALFAVGTTRIRGVEILRHHESDRLAAGACELRKLGARVEEHDDGLTIDPPRAGLTPGVEIDTYLDHRMAMAFAVAGDLTIRDPMCCAKTYPRFFDELAALGMVDAP